jgi:hypothetical protein
MDQAFHRYISQKLCAPGQHRTKICKDLGVNRSLVFKIKKATYLSGLQTSLVLVFGKIAKFFLPHPPRWATPIRLVFYFICFRVGCPSLKFLLWRRFPISLRGKNSCSSRPFGRDYLLLTFLVVYEWWVLRRRERNE